MKYFFVLACVVFGTVASAFAQTGYNDRDLPRRIMITNPEKSSHVQGVAVDVKRGVAYFSFTTALYKTDLQGHLLASLTGLTCHLGCLELDCETGKLYASVEFKDDAIGRGVLETIGREASSRQNSFYIAIFDVERLTEIGMNAETSGVMRTVYLPEVVECYEGKRFGCSGIDGIAIGPAFGGKSSKKRLYVDMALYSDNKRTDNDYQILLEFDPKKIEKYARPLNERNPHHSGPCRADRWLYAYTGNTAYGIQNLEYDAAAGLWFAAVYKGSKPQYPNYSLFAFDGAKKPVRQPLLGMDNKQGLVVSLAEVGVRDSSTGITGWPQNVGSTGIDSLGDGLFYISFNGRNAEGLETCELRLCRYVGRNDKAFEEIE